MIRANTTKRQVCRWFYRGDDHTGRNDTVCRCYCFGNYGNPTAPEGYLRVRGPGATAGAEPKSGTPTLQLGRDGLICARLLEPYFEWSRERSAVICLN